MTDEVLSKEEVDTLVSEQEGESAPEQAEAQEAAPGADAGVRSVEFGQLGPKADVGSVRGVELILDVQMNVAVELGRATMLVRDVLALGPGSVVELDKNSSEPVEVVVNNKTIARGEVVVIDDNFGVRITEIINAQEREADARAA